MFYRSESDQYIQEGVPFEIDETQYPANWINLSTPEEKAELGLQEVITVGERKDDRYYWVSEKLEGAELIITSTPKDFDTVKQMALNSLDQQAYSLLFTSDWMITRKAETGVDLKPEWSTYRDNVRLEVIVVRSQLNNATTVDEIAAIVPNWPTSPDAPVPVADPAPADPVVE
jgi:hypothetical protein